MRDLANLSLGVAVDVLRGQMGGKVATPALAGIRETRRTIQVGQAIGEHRQVLDHLGSDGNSRDALTAREKELTAELEAIRERRGS